MLRKSDEKVERGEFNAEAFLDWMRHRYRPKRRSGKESLGERAAWRYLTVFAHAWKRWNAAGLVSLDPFTLFLDKRYTTEEFEKYGVAWCRIVERTYK